MWSETAITEMLGIKYPIIQAPMAGAATPELAAQAIIGGGLGSLGCAEMSIDQLTLNAARIRELSDGPFNLNFFHHNEPEDYIDPDLDFMQVVSESYVMQGLGTPPTSARETNTSFTDEKLAALLEIKPAVASFHFGLPQEPVLQSLRDAGCRIYCSATTVAEARFLEAAGIDAVIAQGWEAGGHRGTFEVCREDFGIGSMALIPQIVDAVDIPVIAAGGIADGRGIAAAFMLGASAVQLGSAFLSCPEAGIKDAHRQVITNASDDDTRLTRAFSGRPARARNNVHIRSLANRRFDFPEFPLMYHYSEPLMESSQKRGDNDFAFQLYGQATSLNRALPAAELIELLADETSQLLD